MGPLSGIWEARQFIVIPVAVAVLLAALLAPAVRLLTRFRWVPRALATAVVVVSGLTPAATTWAWVRWM